MAYNINDFYEDDAAIGNAIDQSFMPMTLGIGLYDLGKNEINSLRGNGNIDSFTNAVKKGWRVAKDVANPSHRIVKTIPYALGGAANSLVNSYFKGMDIPFKLELAYNMANAMIDPIIYKQYGTPNEATDEIDMPKDYSNYFNEGLSDTAKGLGAFETEKMLWDGTMPLPNKLKPISKALGVGLAAAKGYSDNTVPSPDNIYADDGYSVWYDPDYDPTDTYGE